ncbi:hypothetical protein MLD38_019373 [Melastoma candidum]|uniref:Uncharacterized protein n=1 Tax=Melastoma candidum TaxID=119954 RepID=A0ACB9R0B9_9MYRT|nr:hypothetical protein MLD38_019373 [Melastoma candidum]
MTVLHQQHRISAVRRIGPCAYPTLHHRVSIACKSSSPVDYASSLPSSFRNAEYRRELEAAVDVVKRACRLCVDVKRSLFSGDGSRVVEKDDRTPVTVADFGVQALVSLELGKQFPSIPLVAEEDSASIRATSLADFVTNAVTDKAAPVDRPPTKDDVLKAIDRGGKDAASFGIQPATYWILDPIDGTRGFLKENESLYVVGLALVVGGEIVLGVMGCPNWQPSFSDVVENELQEGQDRGLKLGLIMISHTGCGTWTRWLSDMLDPTRALSGLWTRTLVDGFSSAHEGRFCIPESQAWESLPLSATFKATTPDTPRKDEIVLLKACCGSLCKYMLIASGRASVYIQRVKPKATVKAWDHAVGIICVLEAGGKVTDWEGTELNLAADTSERRTICPNGGVLVTNRNIHDEILMMISTSSSTRI